MSQTNNHVDHQATIIELSGITFSYGDHLILENANLSIHRGDYLGIVGGNGSGKTTLLKIMLGLLTPTQGSVLVFNKPLKDFSQWENIGYVPQQATHFEARFPVTVEEVVLMGRAKRRGLFRRYSGLDREHALAALKEVEMEAFKDRLVGELSGGQAQRVFIARALAGEPEVLILDEPTVGIDEETKEEFYSLLRRLNTSRSLTIVLVSHDLDDVAREAMHVACVKKSVYFHERPGHILDEKRETHAH